MKNITRSLKHTITAAALLSLAIGFTGCASPTKSDSMASRKTDFGAKYKESVSVTVTGGSETSSMGKSQISDESFAGAIKATIEKTALFAKVIGIGADPADYSLHAEIVRVDQPTVGFDMEVTLEVNWTLLRKSQKTPVWQKAETSTFKATMGDAFVGVTRLRMATEGAARLNIEQAFDRIAQLKL